MPRFYTQEQEDEANAPLATPAEADREYARNAGAQNPDHAWILSDRDVWYPNPFYCGPKVRHPEDDQDNYEDTTQEENRSGQQNGPWLPPDDEVIPF